MKLSKEEKNAQQREILNCIVIQIYFKIICVFRIHSSIIIIIVQRTCDKKKRSQYS